MSYTVGELKKFIEKHNIPDDAPIVYQRIEDRYFDGIDISGMTGKLEDGTYGILPPGSKAQGWRTIKKEGFHYFQALEWNRKIDEGYFFDKEKFPDRKPEDAKMFVKYSDEDLERLKEEYVDVFCAVFYDNEHLYLDAHY